MTYEEYSKKNEELTLEEVNNKRVFEAVIDGIDEAHGYNVRNEDLRWKNEKKKARANYIDLQDELGRKKRELKMEYMIEKEKIEAERES
ncbi:MAG: hypothetical protein K5867_04075 [Bacteroidales bacterium]|nr:hypothetical protein [Bacteroidales bacterium]